MPRDVARASLYRAPINLWVEDELTREYLAALWNDPSVAFLVAGGHDGVRAVVRDAKNAGFRNAFGLVDRDFQQSKRERWDEPRSTFPTFVLPVHEIENYLLDPPALAASRLNNLRRTGDRIDGYLVEKAGRLIWWAACRDVVAELRHRFRDSFISDPPSTLADETAAADHVLNSHWYTSLPEAYARTNDEDVRRLLLNARRTAESRLADGGWRQEFAGKEIFRDVGSRICDRTKLKGPRPSTSEFDIDLAKDIAAWQSEQDRVPPDLADLLRVLKSRIAAPPPSP